MSKPCAIRVVSFPVLGLLAGAATAAQPGVYFTQRGPLVGQQAIWRMGLDGSSPAPLFNPGADSHLLQDVAIHTGLDRAFWMHGTPGFFDLIRASDLDGANQYILQDPMNGWGISENSWDLELDEARGRVWMLDSFHGRILHVGLDGTGPVSVVNTGTGAPIACWAPDFANAEVYVRSGRTAIDRLGLDGTHLATIPVSAGPGQMTIDSGRGLIYYAAAGTGDIWRIATDGTGDSLFISAAAGLNGITDIEVDPASGAIYWTDWELGLIHRAEVDGSGSRVVFAGAPGAIMLGLDVVVPAPGTLGVAAIAALGIARRRR